jgi:ketosteroid isomerase-like protein
MRVLSAMTAAVLVVAVGCGGGGSTSAGRHESVQTRQVRVTVEGWLNALNAGDSPRACGYLTPDLRHSIDTQLRVRGEKATCRTFAAKWTGGSTPPGRAGAHITAVTVAGAKASASLAAPPDRESEVKLRELRGHWLIENY